MAVSDISRVDDLLKALEELGSYETVVGILSSAGGELLTIAYVQEFGTTIQVTDKMRGYFRYNFNVNLSTPVIKIPERSFIRSSFDSKEPEIGQTGDELIISVLEGNINAYTFFDVLGQTAANTIRNYLINEVTSPPNSPLTVANKGSSNPLVDTGRLVNSIDYEVRKK